MTAPLVFRSLTARPGGDEGLGRVEQNSSLRLSGMEQVPLDASTPQGEDQPSSLGSKSSTNMVLKHLPLIRLVPV